MAADPCLVLYGNSVFLAGIKADLESRVSLKLITVEAGSADASEQIRAHKPDVLLFDIATGQPEFTVSLLRDRPGMLVICLDPSSNEMLVLSARPQQALSLSDLVKVISEKDLSKREALPQEEL